MIKYHKYFSLVLISLATQAQKSEVDFQTSPAITLNLDLPKGCEISSQYRAKFNKNSSNFRGSYFYLDVDKKLNKYLTAGIGYRFGLVEGEKFNRFSVSLEGKYKYKKFKS